MRMDKWLWAARFFKTRSLAARACELGRVESGGHAAKPAREVRVGDRLKVRNDAGEFEIDVLALSETRGPAAVARTLYAETAQSEAARARAAEERKQRGPLDFWGYGKPTKRDRREIDRLRGRRQ